MAKGTKHFRKGAMSNGVRVLILLGVLAGLLGAPVFAADTPVVIKVWNTEIAQKKFYQQIFKEFNKVNPDIKVEYTAQASWEVLTKALDDAFKAGDPPDLFPASIPFYDIGGPWSLPKEVEQGWLTPLDSVAPSKEALSAWMAKFPNERQPFVEGMNVISGKVFSWPTNIGGFPGAFFYNTRLFLEAGLKGSDGKPAAPETWEDLRSYAKKITQAGQGKVYGIIDSNALEGVLLTMISSGFSEIGFCYWWWGFDHRTGKHDFASQSVKGAIQLWIDMKNDGSVFPGSLSIAYNEGLDNFTKGLAGMYFRWNTGAWQTESQDFDVAPSPVLKKGQRVNMRIGPLAIYGGYVVSNKVKNKETAVWKVVEFMTSQTYQESWVKAISGQGWGSTISVFPQFNKPEFFSAPGYAKIADNLQQMKVGPDIPIGAFKVANYFAPGSPTLEEAIIGIYNGKMDWKVLDEMNVRWDAALDKALADAKKDGVNLTRADFTRPDYNPTKDYVPKKK